MIHGNPFNWGPPAGERHADMGCEFGNDIEHRECDSETDDSEDTDDRTARKKHERENFMPPDSGGFRGQL